MTRLSLSYKNKLFATRKMYCKTSLFFIQYNPHLSFNKKKYLIIISKKSGNAVQRNYIKRITKILIREFFLFLKFNYSFFIFFYKIPLYHVTYQILKNEFQKIIIK